MGEKKFVRTDPSNWHNAKAAGEYYARTQRMGDGGDPPLRKHLPTDLVKVKNITGADRLAGEVLECGESLIDPENITNEFLWFEGKVPSGTEKFGILRASIPDGQITGPGGELQVSGVCKAWVHIQSPDDAFASVVPGSHELWSSASGPYKILWKPPGSGGGSSSSSGSPDASMCVVVFVGNGGGSSSSSSSDSSQPSQPSSSSDESSSESSSDSSSSESSESGSSEPSGSSCTGQTCIDVLTDVSFDPETCTLTKTFTRICGDFCIVE